MKKILIFYSKTGGGHLRSARAIENELKRRHKNLEISLVDGLERIGLGLKTNPSWAFSILSSYLMLIYNFVYQLTNNSAGVSILRRAIYLIWAKNYRSIIYSEAPALIVSTHHFITPKTISRQLLIPFVTVVTDLGIPHRIWFDNRSDMTIVPTEEMEFYAKEVLKIKNVVALGYPTGAIPLKQTDDKLVNRILLIGTSINPGLFMKYLNNLRQSFEDKSIVIVCGHNQQLENRLRKIKDGGLEIHGFIKGMDVYIQNADILITKAGPATILEAVTYKKPLIIIKSKALQERDNIKFVVDNKLGVYEPNPNRLAQQVKHIYQFYKKYSKGNLSDIHGTKRIARFLIDQISY